MKNTKSIALITFSAIQLTAFAISAQQMPNGFTKQNVQQQLQDLKTQNSVAGTFKALTDSKKETSQKETFKLSNPTATSKKEIKVINQTEQALGGADAGGGPNIRGADGKLMTLTEAGLIFTKNVNTAIEPVKTYPSYYILTAEEKAEVRNVLNLLPIDKWAKETIADVILDKQDRSTFIDARSKVDSKIYAKIKADYQKVILIAASKKIKLTEQNFVLPAYSDDKKTYILAEFDQLNLRQKALKLIHEYLMRNDVPMDLKLLPILQFDNVVELYLNSGKSDELTNVTYTRNMQAIANSAQDNILKRDKTAFEFESTYKVANEFKMKFFGFYNYYLIGSYEYKQRLNALLTLQQHLGRPILISELFLKPSELTYQARMDMSLAQQFNSIVPMTTLFEKAQVGVNRDLAPDQYRDDLGYKDYETLINDKKISYDDSAEVKAQKKQATKTFVNELNSICQNYYSMAQKTEVIGDGLIYGSQVFPGIYLVKCSDKHSADKSLKGYAFQLAF